MVGLGSSGWSLWKAARYFIFAIRVIFKGCFVTSAPRRSAPGTVLRSFPSAHRIRGRTWLLPFSESAFLCPLLGFWLGFAAVSVPGMLLFINLLSRQVPMERLRSMLQMGCGASRMVLMEVLVARAG